MNVVRPTAIPATGAEAEAVVNAAQAAGRPNLNEDKDKSFKAALDLRRRAVEELDRVDGWIAEAQDVALEETEHLRARSETTPRGRAASGLRRGRADRG